MFSESGFYRRLIPEEKLMYLIKRNLRPKEVLELITARTNLSYRNKVGMTPIIMATKYFPGFNYQNTGRRIALLRALLEVSPHDVVNVQDNQGFTALMYAAQQSDQLSIALLMHHGADRSIRNKDGLSALDFAKPPFTRALLERGEDQDRLLAVLSKYELA